MANNQLDLDFVEWKMRGTRVGDVLFQARFAPQLDLDYVAWTIAPLIQLDLDYVLLKGIVNIDITERLGGISDLGHASHIGVLPDDILKAIGTLKSAWLFGLPIADVLKALAAATGSFAFGARPTEKLAGVESVSTGAAQGIRPAEVVSMVDAIGWTAELPFGLTEKLTASETLAAAFLYALPLSEVASFTDEAIATVTAEEPGQVFDEILSERFGIQDALRKILTIYATAKSHMRASDNIYLLGWQVAVTIADTLGLTETVAGILAQALVMADQVSLQDATKYECQIGLTVQERAQVTDAVAGIFKFAAIVTDNFSFGEVVVAAKEVPTVTIRFGKTYIFTIDTVDPDAGIAKPAGRPGIGGPGASGKITKH